MDERDAFLCNTACILDTIWKYRNAVIFRKGRVDPELLHNRVWSMLAKCKRDALFKKTPGQIDGPKQGLVYNPPDTGYVKANYDASFLNKET